MGNCTDVAAALRRQLVLDSARRQRQLVAFALMLPFAGLEPLLSDRIAPTAFRVLELVVTHLLEIATGLWLERGRRSGKAGFDLVY